MGIRQIVHDFRILAQQTGSVKDGILALKNQGIEGFICNIPFENYMKDQALWTKFNEFVKCANNEGMSLWLYDECGYPSGFAGGQVLKKYPEYEAIGLYYDEENNQIVTEASYEGTHSSNNFFLQARTINLLEKEAVKSFINMTFDRYRKELGENFSCFEAIFSDEMALNVFYVLPIDCQTILDKQSTTRRKKCGVAWSKALSQKYDENQLYGLFGKAPKGEELRQKFHADVAKLVHDNCFAEIQKWCHDNNILYSGHLLADDEPIKHVPCYGNYLDTLMTMDIPGVDVLSSRPLGSFQHCQTALLFASSAAMLKGTRRVFSESSDIIELIRNEGITTNREMIASLSWQTMMGVTDFAHYYSYGNCPELPDTKTTRMAKDYREVNQTVAKLISAVENSPLEADVFLYYPIDELQQHYVPIMEAWKINYNPPEEFLQSLPESQQPEVRKLVAIALEFERTSLALLEAGITPCLVDSKRLKTMRKVGNSFKIGEASAKAIIYQPNCKCDTPSGFSWSKELPKQLLEQKLIRLTNSNPNVLVSQYGEQKFLLNLLDIAQTTTLFFTDNSTKEIKLEPYELVLYSRG